MKERERYLERALDNGTAESAEVFPEAAEIAAAHAALLAKVDAGEMTLEQAEAEWGKVMAGYADYIRRVSEVYDELHDLREAEIFAAEKKRRAEKAAEKKRRAAERDGKYGGFLKGRSALRAASAEKALGQVVDFGAEGKMTVGEYVEKHHAAGDLTFEKKMVTAPHPRRWNAMSGAEQRRWEETHKPKEDYTVNGTILGKTAYEYAEYLSRNDGPGKGGQSERGAARAAVAKAAAAKENAETAGKKRAAKKPKGKAGADEEIADAGEKIGGVMEEKVDAETGHHVFYQKSEGAAPVSREERVLRDALDERLREGGMEVIDDAAEGQRVLDRANGNGAGAVRQQKDSGGKKPDAKTTGRVRYFRTADGEAYGFTADGKIYYDPRIATSETLAHEYAHLWASALRAGNAKEWRNVVALMKGTGVWEEVKRLYPELKTDDGIADEVLAHYSGRRGAERLRAEAERIAAGKGGVLGKADALSALDGVKRALEKFWKGVCDMLHIHYTSAEEAAVWAC